MNRSDKLIVKPLGAGQEVGRSCVYLEYKKKKLLLDFGIHPGLVGRAALPFIDEINPEEIDLLLVTHFHLDHCGALPWFLKNTNFNGRVFMTHSTKAIYKWLLSDAIRIGSGTCPEEHLFSKKDLTESLDRIETIDFHQDIEIGGINFKAFHAGHVLGAAMFLIKIAGVQILYTGDFSREEDRHLMAAEIPMESDELAHPDILICESTYGTHNHETRQKRESRFTNCIRNIVLERGGRCLIPVFALGRAQELLLIVEEFWEEHKDELGNIPIYYSSSLARKCLNVYQTYFGSMNDSIKKQIAIHNPFDFKHIKALHKTSEFSCDGPCLVFATPGMMQSGFSRDLFENWCSDPRNGVIIAGYSVEGTLAKHLSTNPTEVVNANGLKLPVKCSLENISFSAHTDYCQTSRFIQKIRPPHIILVHGEENLMKSLKGGLEKQFVALRTTFQGTDDPLATYKPEIYCPKNTQSVEVIFQDESHADIVGRLAERKLMEDVIMKGFIVKKNLKYQIIDPSELSKYYNVNQMTIKEKLMIPIDPQIVTIKKLLIQLEYLLNETASFHCHGDTRDYSEVKDAQLMKIIYFDKNQLTEMEVKEIRLFNNSLTLSFPSTDMILLQWIGSPTHDMFADAVILSILSMRETKKIDNTPITLERKSEIVDCSEEHLFDCIADILVEIFKISEVTSSDKLNFNLIDESDETMEDMTKINLEETTIIKNKNKNLIRLYLDDVKRRNILTERNIDISSLLTQMKREKKEDKKKFNLEEKRTFHPNFIVVDVDVMKKKVRCNSSCYLKEYVNIILKNVILSLKPLREIL
ncbi:hypothetical protein SNEBB_003363 [Seison nebaliae]|nr:hypothetical protein SNEBB_003363 [Seison nebaliae]